FALARILGADRADVIVERRVARHLDVEAVRAGQLRQGTPHRLVPDLRETVRLTSLVLAGVRAAMRKVVRRSAVTKVDSPMLRTETTWLMYGCRRSAAASESRTVTNRGLVYRTGPCTTMATYSAMGFGNASRMSWDARADSVCSKFMPRSASTRCTCVALGTNSSATIAHAPITQARQRTICLAGNAITYDPSTCGPQS